MRTFPLSISPLYIPYPSIRLRYYITLRSAASKATSFDCLLPMVEEMQRVFGPPDSDTELWVLSCFLCMAFRMLGIGKADCNPNVSIFPPLLSLDVWGAD